MTNFKSGSGNLDFSGDNEESTDEADAERTTAGSNSDRKDTDADRTPDDSAPAPSAGGHDRQTYPYFVRRNNVGDERDTRLEIHVRDKVADREAQFRHTLAEELGTSDVSKTDAREFALLAAFEHPEQVVELMREEGFDTLG